MTSFPLFLLRHGEPVTPGRFWGHGDIPSSVAGIEACVERTHGLHFTQFVSSDLQRCNAAAQAIGAVHGQTPHVRSEWRELDFGAWDGMAADQIEPAELQRFWSDPDACPPPKGERWSALLERVQRAINALSPEPTLIVTHAGAMRATLSVLCGFDQQQTWAFDLPYAALIRLTVWSAAPRRAQITGLSA